MKHLIVLGLAMLLVSSPLGISYAQNIYWDPDERRDATITASDFDTKFQVNKKAKSWAEMGIYDTGEIDVSDLDEMEPSVVQRPRPRRTIETPRPSRTRQERAPASVRDRDRLPKASERESGRSSSASGPEVTGEGSKTQSKKMKWGRVEVKPVEPKTKLQWGRGKNKPVE